MQLHEEIRRIAGAKFVAAARRAHQTEFPIRVRDLMTEAEARGVSTAGRVPAFCNSIRTKSFLDIHQIEEVRVEGPASKLSTTVIVYYRFRNPSEAMDASTRLSPEDPLLELSGVLRGAIREGASAFLRELRRDREPENRDTENAA